MSSLPSPSAGFSASATSWRVFGGWQAHFFRSRFQWRALAVPVFAGRAGHFLRSGVALPACSGPMGWAHCDAAVAFGILEWLGLRSDRFPWNAIGYTAMPIPSHDAAGPAHRRRGYDASLPSSFLPCLHFLARARARASVFPLRPCLSRADFGYGHWAMQRFAALRARAKSVSASCNLSLSGRGQYR